MASQQDDESISSLTFPEVEYEEPEYPDAFKATLPVRRAVLKYAEAKTIVLYHEEDPEELFKEFPNSIPIPKRFDPCNEIPVCIPSDDKEVSSGVEEERLMIVSVRVSRLGTLGAAMDTLKGNVASWTFTNPVVLMTNTIPTLTRVARAYEKRHLPLYFYEGSALYEQTFNSGQTKEIWSELFVSCLTGVRRRNLLGTLMDNSVVDVRPFEKNDDFSVIHDISRRQYKREWRGFIDPSYTTANLEAGVLRALTARTNIRIRTAKTIQDLERIIGAASYIDCDFKYYEDDEDVWLVHMSGATGFTRSSEVRKMVCSWREHIHIDMPSLHVFVEERVVSITGGNGCLVRQRESTGQKFDESQSVWVDSLVFNSDEMRAALGIEVERLTNPFEFMRYHVSLMPYVLYDGLPRPTLGTFMGPQAIATPRTTLNSSNCPVKVVPPVVETPTSMMLRNEGLGPSALPGINLIVLFANDRRCYEDSVVISQEVNDLGLADYAGTIRHPLPEDVPIPEVNDIIEPETSWYRIGTPGVVEDIEITMDRGTTLVLRLEVEGLRIGDKMATSHGQKQTISCMSPREEMPLCTDVSTGATFRPHVIMAAVSVHNRETVGQIYEARASLQAVNIEDFDPTKEYESYVTAPFGEDGQTLEPAECTFVSPQNNRKVLSSIKGNLEPCKADYGVCRFWVLSHLSRDKQHYASSVPRTIQAPRGKLKGGSVRIGDLDLLTIGAKGLVHSMGELLDSSDACIVSVCKVCERLSLLCDCISTREKQETRDVLTRLGIIKVDICRAVGSIASFKASECDSPEELLVTFKTIRGGQRTRTELAQSIPSSFRYKA